MNLTIDPWIPVTYEEGKTTLVSLRTIYTDADRIYDLAVNPPQRIALMRLLICITQVALDGPEDDRNWHKSYDRIVPESIQYLDTKADCFELYGENPFLQSSELEPTNNATIDKLDFRLSAGNNPTLYDHEALPDGRDQSDGWRALMLLTYQCFSPGGTIGTTLWHGVKTSGNSEHAPCVEGSMLHTFIQGVSLKETIHFNILTKKNVMRLPNCSWGRPVWESVEQLSDDERKNTFVLSYLGTFSAIFTGYSA